MWEVHYKLWDASQIKLDSAAACCFPPHFTSSLEIAGASPGTRGNLKEEYSVRGATSSTESWGTLICISGSARFHFHLTLVLTLVFQHFGSSHPLRASSVLHPRRSLAPSNPKGADPTTLPFSRFPASLRSFQWGTDQRLGCLWMQILFTSEKLALCVNNEEWNEHYKVRIQMCPWLPRFCTSRVGVNPWCHEKSNGERRMSYYVSLLYESCWEFCEDPQCVRKGDMTYI